MAACGSWIRWDFADVLLADEPNGWNAAKLKKLIGGPERRVDLPKHIPVHITYFTAWVDEAGNLQTPRRRLRPRRTQSRRRLAFD